MITKFPKKLLFLGFWMQRVLNSNNILVEEVQGNHRWYFRFKCRRKRKLNFSMSNLNSESKAIAKLSSP